MVEELLDSAPTPAQVRRISGIGDLVRRNCEITECYSRLAAGMRRRTYPCANWCTFATWASKQAGATIRGEDMLDELKRELGREGQLLHPIESLWRMLLRQGVLQPTTLLGRLIAGLHTPFDAISNASAAVARGNLEVFTEIGFVFAEYLAQCPPDAAPDSPEVVAFIGRLRHGPPPDGQDLLKTAFAAYQAQGAVQDHAQRAQLIVLANVQIGLHEQMRLQPQIRAAIDATLAGLEAGMNLRFRGPLQRELNKLSRLVITRALMVLTLPGATLSLAKNITTPFPAGLIEIDNPDLRALVSQYGALPPMPENCGASDWSILEQRMRYISHLFRAYHEDETLAGAPFTAAQVAALERGEIPLDGPL